MDKQVIVLLDGHQIQLDDAQRERLNVVFLEYGDDRNRFITALIDTYYGAATVSTDPIALLPRRVIEVVLFEFIKNTDLDTVNVIDIASIFITKMDTESKVDMDEVTDNLLQNGISGRVFVKGTSEYMNSIPPNLPDCSSPRRDPFSAKYGR